MPSPTLGVTAGVSLLGSKKSSDAASDAAAAQTDSAMAGIAEQQRQFDAIQEMLSPFVEGGTSALGGLLDLGGLNGATAQQEAYDSIENSSEFTTMMQQSENALLQNASATGGLRGGNTQSALATMRPELLNSLAAQQYDQLNGLAEMGQNSAAQVGVAGQNMANSVSDLYAQSGAATAGGYMANAAAYNNGLGGIGTAAGDYLSGLDSEMSNFWGGAW